MRWLAVHLEFCACVLALRSLFHSLSSAAGSAHLCKLGILGLGSYGAALRCRFSTANAVRVRDLFTSLDEDRNEHLSKQEFFG